jgi:hypothetical protein
MARREVTGRKPGDLIERDEPTKRAKPAAQALATATLILAPPPAPRLALTIPEFCEAFRISDDFYYKLKRQEKGPREMRVGTRTLISLAAADEWRREQEAATAGETAAT